jgi:hypothetical protein
MRNLCNWFYVVDRLWRRQRRPNVGARSHAAICRRSCANSFAKPNIKYHRQPYKQPSTCPDYQPNAAAHASTNELATSCERRANPRHHITTRWRTLKPRFQRSDGPALRLQSVASRRMFA